MSYFLLRGWNVAVPEVDVGDDIFVVDDKKGVFYRIQVKTSQAVEQSSRRLPIISTAVLSHHRAYRSVLGGSLGTYSETRCNALILKRIR